MNHRLSYRLLNFINEDLSIVSDKNLKSSKKEPKDQSTSSQFQITPNAMLSSGKLSPPMRVSVSLKPNTPTPTLGKELWHQAKCYKMLTTMRGV